MEPSEISQWTPAVAHVIVPNTFSQLLHHLHSSPSSCCIQHPFLRDFFLWSLVFFSPSRQSACEVCSPTPPYAPCLEFFPPLPTFPSVSTTRPVRDPASPPAQTAYPYPGHDGLVVRSDHSVKVPSTRSVRRHRKLSPLAWDAASRPTGHPSCIDPQITRVWEAGRGYSGGANTSNPSKE